MQDRSNYHIDKPNIGSYMVVESNYYVQEDTQMDDGNNENSEDDLIPKPPPRLAPRGIRSFTVCRKSDETGVSGEGVGIEGVVLASGHCIIHWLFPPPRGGIAIFDSLEDFLKVHVKSHPSDRTIITFEDGEQKTYGEPMD